ncbi:hypothetical protein ACRXCV_05075 [Halobacteriovorax sp. GFR7]|uniref:hypothetical protein n=1 Tax=unclassified Halobacteriovorax TaxID=2639665 RepID=UPI003D9735AE
MKKLIVGLLALGSISSLAGEFKCNPFDGQVDVGVITFVGDPVSMEIESVLINDKVQVVRQSKFENAYMYLSENEGEKEHTALEVVNFKDSYEKFEVSVFHRKRGILGVTSAFRVSRYKCNLNY